MNEQVARALGLKSYKPPRKPRYASAISYARKVFGATQTQLAEIAGVSESTVSRWESGKWEPGHYEILRIEHFARTFGLPLRADWIDSPKK